MMTAYLALGLCLLAEPIPKGEREETILLVCHWPKRAELIVMRSGGTIEKRFVPKGIEGRITAVRLNSTATKALLICQVNVQAPADGRRVWPPSSCFLVDLEKPDEPAKLIYERLTYAQRATWTPDGKSIFVSDLDSEKVNAAIAAKPNDPLPYRSWTIDLGTRKKESLKLPVGHIVQDISNDGMTLLTGTTPPVNEARTFQRNRGYLVPWDTLVPKLLVDSEFSPSRLSPVGSRVLGYRQHQEEATGLIRTQFVVVDKDGTGETIMRVPPEAFNTYATPTFAHNGRSLAFVWYERVNQSAGQPQTINYYLSVADRTGSNMKVFNKSDIYQAVMIFDWR
jgi:hypothetical protein